jgi:hypothetical protein
MQIDGSDTIDPEVFALLGSAVVCLVVFTADPASLTRTKALHALAAISAYLADRHCAAPKMEASRKNLDLFTRALLFDAQETVSHDGGQCVAILGRLLSRGSHPFSDDILGLFVNEAFADSAAPAYRCEVSRVLVGVDSPIKFWRFWDHLVTFSTAACTGKTSSLALEAADASSTEQRADRELAIAAVAALTTTTIAYFSSVRAGGPPAKVHTFADDADKILGTWLAVEDEDLDSPCLWLLARLEADDLLNALSVKDRTAIFAPLSKLYGKTSGSDIGALLKRVLTTLHVEAVEIVSVLEAALTSSAEVAVNGSSDEDAGDGVASAAAAASRHSKRRRVQGGDVDLRSLSTEYILTTEYILDILQFKDSATIGHAHLLFDPLFDFLTYVYPIAGVCPPCHCDPDVRRKDLRSIVDVVGWCCRGLFLAVVGSVHDLTVVGCSVLDCRYCLGLRSETQFSVEHIKQTVLDILSSLCRDIDTDTIPKKALNAETIVKCIKSTNNPQTHQCVAAISPTVMRFRSLYVWRHPGYAPAIEARCHCSCPGYMYMALDSCCPIQFSPSPCTLVAELCRSHAHTLDNTRCGNRYSLLLLSRIAEIAPEGVLQSIMPIFTFMGTTILKQDDNYAFQVRMALSRVRRCLSLWGLGCAHLLVGRRGAWVRASCVCACDSGHAQSDDFAKSGKICSTSEHFLTLVLSRDLAGGGEHNRHDCARTCERAEGGRRLEQTRRVAESPNRSGCPGDCYLCRCSGPHPEASVAETVCQAAHDSRFIQVSCLRSVPISRLDGSFPIALTGLAGVFRFWY